MASPMYKPLTSTRGSIPLSPHHIPTISLQHRKQRRIGIQALLSDVSCISATVTAGHPLLSVSPSLLLASTSTSSLFDLINSADDLVSQQLTTLSPLSFIIVLAAGLLTSLSPCTLSVLPLTIGYIGGFSDSSNKENSTTENSSNIVRATAFAAGLATTLAALGIVSSFFGGAYGQIGDGLPIIVSIVAIIMGLSLLELLPLALPSLDVDTRSLPVPPSVKAYLAGATFALAASPCSTPILATLLAYVSTTQEPLTGAALLFAYALGYVSPLLVAAIFTGALQRVLAVREWSGWVPSASGVLLIAGGTYGLLSRLV